MMAQSVPHLSPDKKRVKVYELRNNDWYDRGTGFCTAAFIVINSDTESDVPREPKVVVESEDQPERLLLDTRICKEDGFQKQQDTLIVWTEPSSGVDMALSFQEAEGCAMIWKFIDSVQQSFQNPMGTHEDSLSDDLALDLPNQVSLPPPELGNLPELEASIRMMTASATGRDALTKCVMGEDYIAKLIPLVDMAEDLESLADLHRLCNIMKTILLLNDTSIIEHAVSDECVLGVVGALEYDPDYPTHKANHRLWLNNQGRYKEVVRIQDDHIRRKIHQTYRLQYLKDVVLARILDDPTFSVLNSLIFFNQVDIVQHLQANAGFLGDLFGIFSDPTEDLMRKKEAVLFIQQCCAIAKNLQPPARQALYNNFLAHGLLLVINFGLRNYDVLVRVGATDILVSMIDHDPQMIRHTIYRQIHENQAPLTDTLIELLLVEVDLGIRSQISDALKVLLDPNQPGPPPENFAAAVAAKNGELGPKRPQGMDPQQDIFLAHFYEHSAAKLFKPLLELEGRTDLRFSVLEDGIFSYLNEILCFYVRHHGNRIKIFALQHNIILRFLQLVQCREKHLQLVAIRFFRHVVSQDDDFWVRQLVEKQVVGPVLDLLMRTLPRDNLLCSACLDLFELIKLKNVKDLVRHVVETHRDKIHALAYLEPFRELLLRYDQAQGYAVAMDPYFLESEDDVAAKRPTNPRVGAMMEHIAVDPDEEAFWNTSDDEEDSSPHRPSAGRQPSLGTTNGEVSGPKPLVDYPSDEEPDESGDTEMHTPSSGAAETASPSPQNPTTAEAKAAAAADASTRALEDDKSRPESDDESVGSGGAYTARARSPSPSITLSASPPERISEKRRREEDEDDELGKLVGNKRRNSSSGSNSGSVASPTTTSTASVAAHSSSSSSVSAGVNLRKKKSFSTAAGGRGDSSSSSMHHGSHSSHGGNKKIAISISSSLKTGGGSAGCAGSGSGSGSPAPTHSPAVAAVSAGSGHASSSQDGGGS